MDGVRARGRGFAVHTVPEAATLTIPSTAVPPLKQTSGPSLKTRWATSRIPVVHTAEIESSVAALFDYSNQVGLLHRPTEGMRHELNVGGGLDVVYAPHRRAARRAQSHELKPGVSVLLDPPHPDQRGLAWRDFIVWPNIFPYFPTDKEHLVIAAATVAPQYFDAHVLNNMLDWQAAAGRKAPVSMLYNGMAGNSEDQLHWHSIKWRLPLERALDSGSLKATLQKQTNDGAVSTFEDGFYGGLIVEGSRAFVAREATTLVDALERRPPTLGKYNVLLLTPKNSQVRLVLIPRSGDLKRPAHGVVTMAGTMLIQSNPPESVEAFAAHARQQLVEPSKLTWLNEVLNQSRHPRLTTNK